MSNIKLTDEQKRRMKLIFDNINALAEDQDFIEKIQLAYEMDDDEITESNEEDFMNLVNFSENISELTRDSFP